MLGLDSLLSHCHASAAGEYIAAEKLEVDFGTCDLVEQIWVYGNSYEVSFCPPSTSLRPTPALLPLIVRSCCACCLHGARLWLNVVSMHINGHVLLVCCLE